MQHNETNIAAIYNGEPAGTPQQEAAKLAVQRAQRANLPKFELKEGEKFYISREKVVETIQSYSEILDTLKTGFVDAPEELRSIMESVVTVSYKSETDELQEKGADAAVRLDIVEQFKQRELTPGYEKRWIFGRRKPNRALRQCMREARAEANLEFAARDAIIAEKERYVYGVPEAPEEVQELYENIMYELAPQKKFKKFEAKYGKRLMSLLTDYTQNLIRILSKQFERQTEEKIKEIEKRQAEEKAAELDEQLMPSEVDAVTESDSDCDEVEDYAPDSKDFEIKEGELDELQELEDSHGEAPLDESAELDNVVVEQLPIESAMAFLPMSAESAESSNESAETSDEKAKNEEKDNNEENS